MIFADLHNHTTASDGDYSPEELIRACRTKAIAVAGVTDHDTVAGLEAALTAGDRLGVRVIPGVEVSVRFKESLFTGTLHLLCYFNRRLLQDERFLELLDNTLKKGRGDGLVRARVKEINAVFGPEGTDPVLKQPMTFDEIAAYAPTVTRRHFALALSERHGVKGKDEINRIIGNSSPAYLPSGVDLDAAAELLARAPVLPVLAHPAAGSFPGGGHYKEVLPPVETVEKLLPRFLASGLKGIEIHYPGHTPEHQDLLYQWAKQHGLLVTGGSDCHDAVERPLGVTGLDKQQFQVVDRALAGLDSDPETL